MKYFTPHFSKNSDLLSWLKSEDYVICKEFKIKAIKNEDTYLLSLDSWGDVHYEITDNLRNASKLLNRIEKLRLKRYENLSNKEILEEYVLHSLENINKKQLFTALKDKPENLMDKEDLDFYNSLPENITVYRGCDYEEVEESGTPLGISWTTDFAVADFFAYRWNNQNGCICKTTVPKKKIRFATNSRKEKEVIILNVENCDIYKKTI